MVNITADPEELIDVNITPLMEKAKNVLAIWSVQGLSLFGKIQIINSLVASIFVYRLAVLTQLSDKALKQIQDIFSNFIWDSKRPKIAYKILETAKKLGGAGLANMKCKDTSLKLQWAYKIIVDEKIKNLACTLVNNMFGDSILYAQLAKKDYKQVLQCDVNFWKHVFHLWFAFIYKSPENAKEILSQPIWLNSSIKVNEKIVHYPMWVEAGINKVRDIWTEGGFMKYEEVCDTYDINSPLQNVMVYVVQSLKNGKNY